MVLALHFIEIGSDPDPPKVMLIRQDPDPRYQQKSLKPCTGVVRSSFYS